MFTPQAPPANFEWHAESIRALRRHLGLSQSALARELGIRQQTVSEWETGMYRPRGASVTILTLLAVSSSFPFDHVEELASGDRRQPASPPSRVRSARASTPRPIAQNAGRGGGGVPRAGLGDSPMARTMRDITSRVPSVSSAFVAERPRLPGQSPEVPI